MIAWACARSHAAPPGRRAPSAASSARRPRRVQLAAPDVRLGLDQAERPAASPAAPLGHARARRARSPRRGRWRAAPPPPRRVPAHRARRLAAALEVLGQRHGVARPRLLEPRRRRAGGRASRSSSVSIAYAASRTSACANDELPSARPLPASRRARPARAPPSALDGVGDVGELGLAAEQRRHAAAPEALAEDGSPRAAPASPRSPRRRAAPAPCASTVSGSASPRPAATARISSSR